MKPDRHPQAAGGERHAWQRAKGGECDDDQHEERQLMKPIVIYHGGCSDGFAAAWAIWTLNPDWEFHPGAYGSPPPDVTARVVFLVDFSYKRQVLLKMAEQAESITVVDHHKSAQSDLVDLPANVETVFDMDKCGCVLTWEYFHPDSPMPTIMLDIQDRDLWKKERPFNDEITMAIRSYPQDFEIWSDLMDSRACKRSLLIKEGESIARYYNQQVDQLFDSWHRSPHYSEIGGHIVPVFNANYMFASELAGRLAKEYPFAAVFWHTSQGVTYSLRSRGDGLDVSDVANLYGGGGHRGAAGFKVEKPLDIFFLKAA